MSQEPLPLGPAANNSGTFMNMTPPTTTALCNLYLICLATTTKSFTTVYDYCCVIHLYVMSKDRCSVSHALNGDGNVTEKINM